MKLAKYSIGVGDRFGRQASAQLDAIMQARRAGIDVVPVWNKSNREHSIIGTQPRDVRLAADAAVHTATYDGPYFVDADRSENLPWRQHKQPVEHRHGRT